MTDEPDAVDVELSRRLGVALEAIDVDVDAQWVRFVDGLGRQRRRSLAGRAATAAAVLLLFLTAGRPLAVAGGEAVIRFLSEVTGSTLNWVAESIEERVPGLGGGGGGHAEIDESNDYWVAIRSVHEQLNDAVGYDRWEPDELDGAAAKLDDLAGADPEFQDDVRSAAGLIRRAQAEGDRDAAVGAHRLIEQIERELRRR